MAIEKTPLFATLEDAKAFAAKEHEAGKKDRSVYVLRESGFADVFIVAPLVQRAHDHAIRVMKERHGITIGLADRSAPTVEEQIKQLSPEELKRMKDLIKQVEKAQKAASSDAPQQ